MTPQHKAFDEHREGTPGVRVSIRRILSISIICLILFISAGSYILFLRLHSKTIEHVIRSKGIFVTRILNRESLPHLAAHEYDPVQGYVKDLTIDEDVLYAAVLDADGRVIAEAPAGFRHGSTPDIGNISSAPLLTPFFDEEGRREGYTVTMGIVSADGLIGMSTTIVSFRTVHRDLSTLRNEILFLIGFIALIGVVLSLFLSKSITRPILDLIKASGRIREGASEVGSPTASRTEIGLLARFFVEMAGSIRQYRERILNQNNEIKAIIDSMGSGLFTIDREWRITSFNRAAERITGFKEEEVLGKKCEEVFHSEACTNECPMEKALQADACILSHDFYVKNKQGKRIPINASASPLKDESGRVIGAVEVFKDLTELKDLQKQLIQADKMAALGQMISGIAHDINNPTGVIHSNIIALSEYMEVIRNLLAKYHAVSQEDSKEKRDALFEEIKGYEEQSDIDYILEDLDCLVEESKEAAKRITHIVRDLRNFIHIDVGQLQMTDLNQRLDACLKLIKFNQTITVVRDYAELPPVYCNAQQIDQIFTNILLNASQALGDKGEIRITTSGIDGRVRVSIRDNGPGIPEDILPKIFDPFFTTKEIGEGTGLGLSICFRIVTSHGGKIWVESEPENWTEFFVELPVTPQETFIIK